MLLSLHHEDISLTLLPGRDLISFHSLHSLSNGHRNLPSFSAPLFIFSSPRGILTIHKKKTKKKLKKEARKCIRKKYKFRGKSSYSVTRRVELTDRLDTGDVDYIYKMSSAALSSCRFNSLLCVD